VPGEADLRDSTHTMDLDDEAIPVVTGIALLQPADQPVE
jgi:hypothetical protein